MLLSSLMPDNCLLEQGYDPTVTGITLNCFDVKEGYIFVCIKGKVRDGHDYIDEAIARGASCIIIEDPDKDREHLIIKVDSTRRALADLSCRFYDNPSHKLKLVGITGTNGKTSVAQLLAHICTEAGYKSGTIGTLGERIDNKAIPSDKKVPTTPEAHDLQQTLDYMVKEQVQMAALEVTSIGLDMQRVDGCSFSVGIFTNLTQDHLDYHGSMKHYIDSKLKLFPMCASSIINLDDELAPEILKLTTESVTTYSLNNQEADLRADIIKADHTGTKAVVHYKDSSYSLATNQIGAFNIYNSLAAIGAALHLGIPIEQSLKSLNNVPAIPGRCEQISSPTGFTVIIDYAHTPDALYNLLSNMREQGSAKLILIFGCGGDRDKSKRPLMGKIAGELADAVIITSDNPRSEDPDNIIKEIISGIDETKCRYYTAIPNRNEAINAAITLAQTHDLVLIAGKGHETYQEISGKKIPFDDKVVALKAINRLTQIVPKP